VETTAQRDSRDEGMPPDCAPIEVDWWLILGEAGFPSG